MKTNNDTKYTKVLVAQYSPQNGCNVTDGEMLIIKPPVKEPNKEFSYHFEGVMTGRKSRYGWVKTVPEYTLENYIDKYLKNISEKELVYLECMLNSISNLQTNTPVAVDYRQKSMGEPIFVLHVHKVIFYKQDQ
ncbi:hypothetical protein [Butyricimonas faecalis]|uniref:Uncharacterized protein n=1 Tax=Butyricimonas faecalis TaxID=2093856 RepID=A0A3Q9IS29_9BACT|nr:hypothetical protein [Butyricimonas faecalis]AZS31504.1 hypothetical protein D8S85_19435 [Butyricimonas faecalis]